MEVIRYAVEQKRDRIISIQILFKQFSTKIHVDKWYHLSITFHETETVYHLTESDLKHHHCHQILETERIHHRSCPDFTHGTMQSFYFSGLCPAPQPASICYKRLL